MASAPSGAPFDFTPLASTPFVAPTSAVCVNTLWYLSLSLSVGVSLVALLGKDWVRAYMSELTGQPYQQARKRQKRWDSLKGWRMPQVIVLLPILLHLALRKLAPTSYAVRLFHPLEKHVSKALATVWSWRQQVTASLHMHLQPRPSDPEVASLDEVIVEHSAVSDQDETQTEKDNLMDILTSRAIAWLLVNYEDTKSADIALQAIAGANIHLPMQPLMDCYAGDLLLQRLDNCYTTRQKTGRRYLKNSNLLEPASLYSRALATIPLRGSKTLHALHYDLSECYRYVYRLAETPLCLLNQSLKPGISSPNKAAFALASWALIELDDFTTSTWAAKTADFLESRCDNSGALEREAWATLLKSISYVLATQNLDNASLLIALVRLHTSSEHSDPPAAAQIGAALLGTKFLRPDTTSDRPTNDSRQDMGLESQRSHYMRFIDTVMKRPERIPLSLSDFGLLELLKHLPQAQKRSDLVTIYVALQNKGGSQDSLEIQGFVIARSGYNSGYFADVVIPRVKPVDDGSFVHSELVRAIYLSVVNIRFLNTLTDSERLDALKLGLLNLESATTNCLKQSCCNLVDGFARCDFFLDHGIDPRRGDSLAPLLPLFPLLPLSLLLQLTESTDERILPYAMQALWMIAELIGFSNMSAGERETILEPVLSHEPFASARSKTNNEVCSSSELAKHMGFPEVWLSRLENIQGEALRHIYDSVVLRTIIPDAFGNPNSEPNSLSVRGRALALYGRCYSENKAAGDKPLWSLDDDLAGA
ncbi:hypothetical protein FRC09_003554 [Ceratobasidium sp. 395]|nr:hypothetical protein FRC09_003554 [Ceratobasidium sp. 395]